jgi:hypothetical protein
MRRMLRAFLSSAVIALASASAAHARTGADAARKADYERRYREAYETYRRLSDGPTRAEPTRDPDTQGRARGLVREAAAGS